MYEFFKQYNKQLLAFFGVALMIAFLMPNFQTGQAPVDPPMGTIGTEQVRKSHIDQARYEWEFLGRKVVMQSGATGDAQWRSILGQVPPQLSMAIEMDPANYYLLQQEARKMGLTPPLDEADEILQSPQFALVNIDQRILPAADVSDRGTRQTARGALANLLMVINGFQRAISVVKVSEPLINHEVALRLQQIKVRLVDFPAKDFADKVPAPTPEQLQKHFDLYSNVEPGGPASDTNLFGFGYKYPNRVKLQYVVIPRDDVRRAVRATRDDYGWEVEAQRYYISHQSDFPTTAPAATQESFVLLPAPAQPTTKPFAEVRKEIESRVIEPLVDRLMLQIQSDVSSRLSTDYHTYGTARGPSTLPATAPANLPFESFEYLQKLAADIQTRHKVTLTIAAVSDSFKTVEELRELKDIGKVMRFPELAVAAAEPFVNEEQRNNPAVLSLFEPSRTLTDDSGSVYFYRLTAVDKSHPPTSIDAIRPKLEEDWKRAQAFDLARAEAQKLLDAAKAPGLDVAGGEKVIMVGPYSANASIPLDNYTLSSTARGTFIRDTYKLLSLVGKQDSGGPRPITLVPMAVDERVAVAELIAIDSSITPQSASIAQMIFGPEILRQYASPISEGWFDPTSIAQRMNYTDLTKAQ